MLTTAPGRIRVAPKGTRCDGSRTRVERKPLSTTRNVRKHRNMDNLRLWAGQRAPLALIVVELSRGFDFSAKCRKMAPSATSNRQEGRGHCVPRFCPHRHSISARLPSRHLEPASSHRPFRRLLRRARALAAFVILDDFRMMTCRLTGRTPGRRHRDRDGAVGATVAAACPLCFRVQPHIAGGATEPDKCVHRTPPLVSGNDP